MHISNGYNFICALYWILYLRQGNGFSAALRRHSFTASWCIWLHFCATPTTPSYLCDRLRLVPAHEASSPSNALSIRSEFSSLVRATSHLLIFDVLHHARAFGFPANPTKHFSGVVFLRTPFASTCNVYIVRVAHGLCTIGALFMIRLMRVSHGYTFAFRLVDDYGRCVLPMGSMMNAIPILGFSLCAVAFAHLWRSWYVCSSHDILAAASKECPLYAIRRNVFFAIVTPCAHIHP